ncbi:MAG: hypothetical protein QOD78_338, partial [Chloroflexota bacterium]|nr:hypothetical protein [Chloroflexota bacterium]
EPDADERADGDQDGGKHIHDRMVGVAASPATRRRIRATPL